MLDNSRNRF